MSTLLANNTNQNTNNDENKCYCVFNTNNSHQRFWNAFVYGCVKCMELYKYPFYIETDWYWCHLHNWQRSECGCIQPLNPNSDGVPRSRFEYFVRQCLDSPIHDSNKVNVIVKIKTLTSSSLKRLAVSMFDPLNFDQITSLLQCGVRMNRDFWKPYRFPKYIPLLIKVKQYIEANAAKLNKKGTRRVYKVISDITNAFITMKYNLLILQRPGMLHADTASYIEQFVPLF